MKGVRYGLLQKFYTVEVFKLSAADGEENNGGGVAEESKLKDRKNKAREGERRRLREGGALASARRRG